MRKFRQEEIEAAVAWAAKGGQALHLHRMIVDRRKAPKCFIRDVDAGKDIAHLFDQDLLRLMYTARKLGVNIILVERKGRPSQHIDLCGKPLQRAIDLCESGKAVAFGKPV